MRTIIVLDDLHTLKQTLHDIQSLTADEYVQSQLVARQLSPREQEVVLLDYQGLKRRSIAQRLCVTERTIEFHWRSVYEKTCLTNREQVRGWVADLYREAADRPLVPLLQQAVSV